LTIDHIGIAVSDIAKSIDFYHRCLGMQIIEELKAPNLNVHLIFLKSGNCMIELLDYTDKVTLKPPHQNNLGIRHFTLLVENLDEEYNRLKKMGVKFTRYPQVIIKDRIRNAFLTGPDGESIELMERIS
jgi:lactoylglutathione lyase